MEFAARVYKDIIFPVVPQADSPLSDLQKAMLDATPDCIKILSIDGRLISINKAGCVALGVPEDSDFGMPWLPLLPEGVRDIGLKALHQAAQGFSARFTGQSRSATGMQYWDNLLTPIIDTFGRVNSILCVSRDVTSKTLLEGELEDAFTREKLLSQEMRHRIKNLFAIVHALISISEKEAGHDQASGTATKILREKITALSRASDAAFSLAEFKNADPEKIDLGSIVNFVLKPYLVQCRTAGSRITTGHNNLTTIALFLHELATNSLKYGALSADCGLVEVHWTAVDHELNLTWAESGGPPIPASPNKRGFGSEMVERIIHSAGGRLERTWPMGGLVTQLHLPNFVSV